MEDSIDNKIKKLINISDNKNIKIGYESYGSCCIVVPKFTISITKNNSEINASALEIEDCLDNLLEKLNIEE